MHILSTTWLVVICIVYQLSYTPTWPDRYNTIAII